MNFEEIIKAIEVKPYYQDDAVVIYHADCRDILPLIPDKSIDLVLTDPPYNVGLDYSDGDKRIDYPEWCSEWFMKLPRPLFFTPGMINLSMWYQMATPSWLISWVKPNQCSPSGLGGFNTWEPILVYGKPKKHIGQDSFVMSISTNQSSVGNHPCPKDERSWLKLITIISDSGDLILDPFLGSGTTTYCAKKLGRKCIGVEIEERYCQIAVRRLQQAVLPFEVEQVKQGKGDNQPSMFPAVTSPTKGNKVRSLRINGDDD